VNAGYFARTAAIAFGQNGSAVIPQLRRKISGNTSIAMSQRTPSHLPAIAVNSPICTRCNSGLA
jgi:hypothetical protein